jgi:putative ABC transport system substrate-binding protein
MNRRGLIVLLGSTAAAWPLAARAQQAAKVYRIGFLGNSTAVLEADLVGPFREGLRDLGYVEGQNILVEYRWAQGEYERFPALTAELIALRVDVIVTAGTPASLAVQKAATSIPLVMVAVGDPVATGLVASLGRPGGNITGLTSISSEMAGKRLELLREVVPKLSHVAVLWNAASPIQVIDERETRAAAQALGMKMLSLGVRSREEIEDALTTIPSIAPPSVPTGAGTSRRGSRRWCCFSVPTRNKQLFCADIAKACCRRRSWLRK